MSSPSKRSFELSPERRALLEIMLREEGVVEPPTARLGRMKDLDVLPLSFAQERLWFLSQLEPSIPAYNIPVAARITGPLNTNALEQSLSEVLRRHEAL